MPYSSGGRPTTAFSPTEGISSPWYAQKLVPAAVVLSCGAVASASPEHRTSQAEAKQFARSFFTGAAGADEAALERLRALRAPAKAPRRAVRMVLTDASKGQEPTKPRKRAPKVA